MKRDKEENYYTPERQGSQKTSPTNIGVHPTPRTIGRKSTAAHRKEESLTRERRIIKERPEGSTYAMKNGEQNGTEQTYPPHKEACHANNTAAQIGEQKTTMTTPL